MRISVIHITVFLIVALLLAGAYIHEVTHQVILENFDVNSTIVVGGFSKGHLATTIVESKEVSLETRNAIVVANSFNEVVGYNVMPFLVVLTALSFAQFIVLSKISLQLEVKE